ncbi:MAG: SpoIIE family protein phosphatase [Acidobacteriota bacterium]
MKSRTLLYIPLVLLFVLTAVVFFQHARPILISLGRLVDQSHSVRFPFEIRNGQILDVLSEAESAGMKKGDTLVGMGGHALRTDTMLADELNKFHVGDTIVYTVERRETSGDVERHDIAVEARPLNMSVAQTASDFAITFLFQLCLPLISFLLAFYVAFMRSRDPVAWMLLFLLLGIGSIAFEDGPRATLLRVFQQTAMDFMGIAMLLFGLYFPERLELDRRRPWAKWILILPLAFLGVANLIERSARFFAIDSIWRPFDKLTSPFGSASTILTMIAFGCFFAALATKSATLENHDSRRRLRILYVGTSIAVLPSLFIILYRIISGRHEGFTQLVPEWFAIVALLAILLFPLTMAYVIVVQRAMDVSVVVRQGIQYALAKNGVLLIQLLLSFVVILIALSFVSDAATNRLQKMIFIGIGVAFVFLIRLLADKIKTWVDRRFFREAYNAEQILSELSDDVRTMVETKPLLETVAGRISESLHVPQVSLLLKHGDKFIPAYSLGFDTEPVVALSGDSKSIRKLGNNQHIVLYDDMTEITSTPTMSLSDREQLSELNSQVLLPVTAKSVLSGIISLSPKRSEEPYTATDLRLLRSVASQTGLALENSRLTEAIAREAAQKERMNTELEIAREVQERLFPQELPVVEGLDFFGACRPALGVGGDYYDFLELPENRFGIAIGDISGKGIGASLMMASLQASLRGQTLHFGNDLAGLMSQINSLVYEASTTNRYATFFYAQYEKKTRMLSYVNAGHNPPFLIRVDGSVLKLEEGGAVVGMLPPMLVNYTQGEIQLAAGDLLVGYTDGISEAMNPNEEEWGEDAMLESIKTVADMPAAQILPFVVAAADRFADGAKQHDDMTMVIVKVL